MGSLYVTITARLSRATERLTGIPRVEYEIAREMVRRGGVVLQYDRNFRRFHVAEFQRAIDVAHRKPLGLPQWASERLRAVVAPRLQLNPGDTIVVPAILWRSGQLADLAKLRQTQGVRLGVYVHDIMPIRHPELVSNDRGAADVRRFMDAMIGCADWLCVSSQFVAEDLTAYIQETSKRDVPVHRVPLCADLKQRTAPELTPRLKSQNLAADNYVLYVSTLNPRKNHAGIYWLWRRLAAELGETTPPLVLAGQRGWNDSDIFHLMSHDREMWGRHIRFIEGPSDAELVHLYRDCAFTVFPSYHEGWGLPITESLSFAKPCVAGDNTSLREAGQGLATHVDDLDGPGWLNAVKRLALDTQYRRDCSKVIAARYQQRTWHEVGEELFGLAMPNQYQRPA